MAKVPIPGAPDGEKPTRISGGVVVHFVEKKDGELSRHLEQVAARQGRPEALSFVIQLKDGRRLEDCSVAGSLGGRNGALWSSSIFRGVPRRPILRQITRRVLKSSSTAWRRRSIRLIG